MATLQATNFTSTLQINGYQQEGSQSDVTPWWYSSHCANADSTSECNPTYSCGWLHVRTPIRADTTMIGWQPVILHVVGFHSYSGERMSDWKALLNVNGSTNGWYGSQIMNDRGNGSSGPAEPYVYRSANEYGGHQRVCFSIRKIGCCCTGWLWVRWYNRASFWNDHPWATKGMASQQANAY